MMPSGKEYGNEFFFEVRDEQRRRGQSIIVYMLMDDDLEHGLISDAALTSFCLELIDDRRIEQDQCRHLAGPRTNDYGRSAPSDILCDISAGKFV